VAAEPLQGAEARPVAAEPLQGAEARRQEERPEAAQHQVAVVLQLRPAAVVLQLRLEAAARLPPEEVPVRHPPVALLLLPLPEVAAIAGQPRGVHRLQAEARQQGQAVVIARLTVAIAEMKSR